MVKCIELNYVEQRDQRRQGPKSFLDHFMQKPRRFSIGPLKEAARIHVYKPKVNTKTQQNMQDTCKIRVKSFNWKQIARFYIRFYPSCPTLPA